MEADFGLAGVGWRGNRLRSGWSRISDQNGVDQIG